MNKLIHTIYFIYIREKNKKIRSIQRCVIINQNSFRILNLQIFPSNDIVSNLRNIFNKYSVVHW